jgi:hypothetical protein
MQKSTTDQINVIRQKLEVSKVNQTLPRIGKSDGFEERMEEKNKSSR